MPACVCVCVSVKQPWGFNQVGIAPHGGDTELAADMPANKDITSNKHVLTSLAWQIMPLTLPPKPAILIDVQADVNDALVCI